MLSFVDAKSWKLFFERYSDANYITFIEWVGMGREEGGGFRMGNTCIPVADSF